jgi:hypothetical protein
MAAGMGSHVPVFMAGIGLGVALTVAVVPSRTQTPAPARVDGTVLTLEGAPVAGATVVVDASPPRIATTDEDGYFVFDGLPDRPYLIEAGVGDQVAGPITVGGDQPVVLRLRGPMTLEAAVVPWLDDREQRDSPASPGRWCGEAPASLPPATARAQRGSSTGTG